MKGLPDDAQLKLDTLCREFRIRPCDVLGVLLDHDLSMLRQYVAGRIETTGTTAPADGRRMIVPVGMMGRARKSKYGFEDMALGERYLVTVDRQKAARDYPVHSARLWALRRGLSFGYEWHADRDKVWIWFEQA